MRPISVLTRGVLTESSGLPLATRGFIYPVREITPPQLADLYENWISDHRREQRYDGQQLPTSVRTWRVDAPFINDHRRVQRYDGQQLSGTLKTPQIDVEPIRQSDRWSGQAPPALTQIYRVQASIRASERWSGEVLERRRMKGGISADVRPSRRYSGQQGGSRPRVRRFTTEVREN